MLAQHPITAELATLQQRLITHGLNSEFATVRGIHVLVLTDGVLFCDYEAFPIRRPVGLELAAVLLETA